jgi:sarcosine oxidase subunit alpha
VSRVNQILRGFAGAASGGRAGDHRLRGRARPRIAGEPVAAALFAAGIRTLGRSTKYPPPARPVLSRRPLRLVHDAHRRPPQPARVHGAGRGGLACERQNAFPSADVDLLAAADWLFPRGMDHHTLMTGSRTGNAVFLEDGPRDGRLGHAAGCRGARDGDDGRGGRRVRDRRRPRRPWRRPRDRARGAGRARRRVRRAAVARRFAARRAGGGARAGELAAQARAAGARVVPNATAIGFFPEDAGADGRPGLLAVATEAGLVRVSAKRTLYATGAYDQNLPFADNDRPGVIAARALGRLAFRWGIRPVPAGARVVILDGAPTAAPLERALAAAGVEVERVDVARQSAVAAVGATRLRGIEIVPRDGKAKGKAKTVAADLVAVAAVPAPASELPRQHGAAVAFDAARGGFAPSSTTATRRPSRACSRAATSPVSPAPPPPNARAPPRAAHSRRRCR